jgi:hypothetical protein
MNNNDLYLEVKEYLMGLINQYEEDDEMDSVSQWLDKNVLIMVDICKNDWLQDVWLEEVKESGEEEGDFEKFVLANWLLVIENELFEKYGYNEDLWLRNIIKE